MFKKKNKEKKTDLKQEDNIEEYLENLNNSLNNLIFKTNQLNQELNKGFVLYTQNLKKMNEALLKIVLLLQNLKKNKRNLQ